MHTFPFLSVLSFGVAGSLASDILSAPETPRALEIPRYIPDISVIEANKSYIVKLECLGCPFAEKTTKNDVFWRSDRKNALRLGFTIEDVPGSVSVLSLNGRHIMPLDPLPLNIDTWQVAANLTTDDTDKFMLSPSSDVISLSMAFEHTVLRTQEGGQTWIQFDATRLFLATPKGIRTHKQADIATVTLAQEDQKLVQILLQQDLESRQMSIRDIQVVARKDREQPYRMKCGKLAMVQTRYNPSEWDEYGQIGTWSRLFAEFGDFFNVQHNPLLLPLSVMVAISIWMARRWLQKQQQEDNSMYDDEAQVALLEVEYEDLPPSYINIPMIKIEEYD